MLRISLAWLRIRASLETSEALTAEEDGAMEKHTRSQRNRFPSKCSNHGMPTQAISGSDD